MNVIHLLADFNGERVELWAEDLGEINGPFGSVFRTVFRGVNAATGTHDGAILLSDTPRDDIENARSADLACQIRLANDRAILAKAGFTRVQDHIGFSPRFAKSPIIGSAPEPSPSAAKAEADLWNAAANLVADAHLAEFARLIREHVVGVANPDPDGLLIPLPTRMPPERVIPEFPLATYLELLK